MHKTPENLRDILSKMHQLVDVVEGVAGTIQAIETGSIKLDEKQISMIAFTLFCACDDLNKKIDSLI